MMIRSATAILVAFASVSSLAMLQPAVPPTETPVTKATLEEVKEVPAEGAMSVYVASQAPIIAAAFCIQDYAELAVFKLSKSAILAGESVGGGGGLGELTWTSLYVSEYDFNELPATHPYSEFIGQRQAAAALIIGELKGTCGVSPCIALAFDVNDEQGQPMHHLIPLAPVTPDVHDAALIASGRSGLALLIAVENPCGGGTPCHNTYRQRLSAALAAMTQCMKGTVPPIGIAAVACIVGCVPLLSGTPILYALCVATCTAVVSLPGTAVDLTTCSNELEAAKANAKASYCACLQYQASHCPNMAESDAVGCP